MDTCNQILKRLSLHLDGEFPETSLSQLRQEAQQSPECLPLFEAMLWVHQSLTAAPMLEASRDFTHSVTRALTWQRRREKSIMTAILVLSGIITLTPMLLLLGTGLTVLIEPNVLAGVISWGVAALNTIAAVIIATLNTFKHMPQWTVIPISTFVSLSLFLLSIILVIKKAPDQLLGTATISR